MKRTTNYKSPKIFKVFNLTLLITLLLLVSTPTKAQLANGKAKWVGNIIGNNVPGNFDNYWNAITMENAGKWSEMEPNRGTFSWQSNTNNVMVQAYNKAVSKGYPFKAHTFVWRNQVPGWLPGLNANDQRGAINRIMYGYFDRFPKTAFVDVVNEPLDGHAPAYGGNGSWMKFNGNNDIGKWSWIKWAFERAKAARADKGSNAKLLINDYFIIESDENTDTYINLINAVNGNGRNLIEGIGVQAHFAYNPSDCGNYDLDTAKIKRNLDKLATTGLPIYVSEFDMNIGNDQEQKNKFMALFRVFWEHPAVKGITLWGYNQGQTWLPCSWLVNGSNERPALSSLRNYLNDQGGGDDDGAFTPGSVIALKGNNGKYVCSENGNNNGMNCNRGAIRSWEKFTVVDAGGGLIALRGNNGKYVSSENGTAPMRCNRNSIGDFEKFNPINTGGGTYGLRGNNGRYVSSENGSSSMTCNRTAIGSWEKFTLSNTSRSFENNKESIVTKLIAYPNPANSTVNIEIPENVFEKDMYIIIYDLVGRSVQKNKVTQTTNTINVEQLKSGNYIAKISNTNQIIRFTKR